MESGGQWTSVGGFVQTTADSLLSDLRYGHKVECVGWLFRPRGPSNPGEVDFRQVLERKGIHATFLILDRRNLKVFGEGRTNPLLKALYSLNRFCQDLLYRHVSAGEVPLLDGLLLGNRESISPKVNEEFIATGTRHILAISGLHVGLITAGVLSCLLYTSDAADE